MGQKRFAKEPLLYIHQPDIQKPEARMQDHYYTAKKDKPSRSEETGEKLTKPKRKRTSTVNRNYFRDLLKGENESLRVSDRDEDREKDFEMEQAEKETNEKNQTFKEMTLIERVHYFLNMPEHIPKMKCEVETEESRHRGIIIDFKDNIVIMRTGSRMMATKEIPFDDIKSIQMIGF